MGNELVPFAYESIAVTSANGTVRLTTSTYRPSTGGLPARKALVFVAPGPNISFTLDGSTVATSTVGHQITSFMYIELFGEQQIRNFMATSAATGTAGKVTVTYFK